MKKENFVTLILGSIGVILFSIGMCMCMLPQWNAFRQGIVVGAVGLAALLITVVVRRKMQGKPAVKFNAKSIGAAVFGVFGALVFGVGMCMALVWNGLLIPGIIVGVVGIVLLLVLIPLCKGLR